MIKQIRLILLYWEYQLIVSPKQDRELEQYLIGTAYFSLEDIQEKVEHTLMICTNTKCLKSSGLSLEVHQ